jgi:hypothetical protein
MMTHFKLKGNRSVEEKFLTHIALCVFFSLQAILSANRATHTKLLTLPGFAGAVSVDDIDDLDDNDVVMTLNVSRNINWRAAQVRPAFSACRFEKT